MAERESSRLFTISRIVFFILSLLVFGLVIQYIDKLDDIKTLLLEMSPIWLFIAIGFQVSTYFLFAIILHILLQKNKGIVNFLTLFKVSIVILFINQVIPSGGLSGNGYIFNQLVKRKVPSSKAFTVLVVVSICSYIAMIILLALFYNLYRITIVYVNSVITYTTLIGFVFYSFLGVVMLGLSNKRMISFILNKLSRFDGIRNYIEKVNLSSLSDGHESTVKVFLKNKKGMLLTILFQLCIIACDIFTAFAIVRGFHINLSLTYISLGVLLSFVIGAFPISPGSLIVYESAMTYFFTILGAPIHAAIIITLIFRFFTFWLPIPIGLLFYRNLQRMRN